MADETFTAGQVARAADMQEAKLRLWRQRGYLDDLDLPNDDGWARYTLKQAMQIAAFADLVRFGLSPGLVGKQVKYLHSWKDDHALLLVWHGPIRLIPTSRRGGPPRRRSEGPWSYDPSSPEAYTRATIIRSRDLSDWITAGVLEAENDDNHADVGPRTRGLLVVNLDRIEGRVRNKLGGTR